LWTGIHFLFRGTFALIEIRDDRISKSFIFVSGSYRLLRMTTKPASERKAAVLKWLKKLGFWGFMFFLVKGLVWLALGYWVFK